MSNCNCGGCGCSVCQPANVVYNAVCTDPGLTNFGVALAVLDANFCLRRLANPATGGLVVVNLTTSGYQVTVSNSPVVSFATFSAVSGSTVGTLLVEDSTGAIKALSLPAVSGLYLSTNAAGQLILGPLPTFTVPDPLNVNTANITNLTANAATFTGPAIKLTGLVAGTIASQIGLDATGNIVIGAAASSGVQTAMFFESPTSPSGATPNSGATAGSLLIIGNQLYDSGGALVTVTNSQTLAVAVTGKYKIDFCAQLGYTNLGTGTPALNLLVNGIIVNTGNGRGLISSTTDRTAFMAGFEVRNLTAGDTLQLQLSAASGTHTHVYEARLVAQKFG